MDDELKALVRSRANRRCEYCHIDERHFTQLFQIEHIVATSHGGTDEAQNLALACRRCNLHKGPNLAGLDPATDALTRLFHPRNDQWDEHFSFDEDGAMTGLTDVGRTTVRVLNMNDPRRVELRKAIRALEGGST